MRTVAAFNKYINSLSIEELQNELKMLFTKVPEVKEFYQMELGDESSRAILYKKAKTEIQSRYATKSRRRPRRPRIQKVNKLLNEMKKKSIFSHELVDLYIFDLEQCIALADEYHIFTQVMQNHLNKVFEKTIRLIQSDKLEDLFKERCEQIIIWTRRCREDFRQMDALYAECFDGTN